MRNLGRQGYLGSYLYQSLEACANFANGDKKAFSKEREKWKGYLNQEVKSAVKKCLEEFKALGFSNADVTKSLNASVKEAKNDVFEKMHSMSVGD